MWRIIKFIFTGVWNPHQHSWKIINKGKLLQSGRLVGERYVMLCNVNPVVVLNLKTFGKE